MRRRLLLLYGDMYLEEFDQIALASRRQVDLMENVYTVKEVVGHRDTRVGLMETVLLILR